VSEPQRPQGHPSPPFIATAPALEALALLDRGLGSREPVVLVTSEPGGGKSMLVREALQRWGARVCARPLAPAEATAETLFAVLLGRFGGTENSQASGAALAQRLLEAIAHSADGGKVVMVVVDEAQTAANELLLQLVNVAETVRRRNHAFEVLLVGTPELSARLNDPALSGLAEKVGSQVRLSPLTQHDTRHYLLQRGGADGAGVSGMFSRKACRDIHGATFGIPRAIEALADESARRATKAGATTISPEHVRAATQALRARRGQAPPTVIASRAERMNVTAPKPAAKPATAPANGGSERPAAAPAGAANGPAAANGRSAPSGGNARTAGANAAPPRAEQPKHAPAVAKGAPPAPKASPPEPKVPPPTAVPVEASAAAATAPETGEQKFPDGSDPRVKDWVSRFGGGGPVRIGVGRAVPQYEASATLDVPPPAKPSTPARILIVDEEPQLPPELIARLNKLTRKKRRRGPSATLQGAALALAAVMLMVVLARQAGFGKRLGLEAADTSARPVGAAPAPPPLALDTQTEPHKTQPRSTSTREPVEARRHEPPTRAKPKPTSKRAVTLTPEPAPETPPIPDRTASGAPVQTEVPPLAPQGDDSPAGAGHKFGIIAGSFATNDMAKAEKDHLGRLVPYRVWVDKSKVQGVRTYQLMVGRFDTMEHAWDSGQTLMRRGLIRDVSVRPLTAREAR